MQRRADKWMEIVKPRVRIHDMYPFGFLDKIKGLGSYASRALVQRGIVFSGYEDERSRRDIMDNFYWLRDIGIGAEELVMVRGSNITGGILKEDGAFGHVERIRNAVARGMPLDFYLSRGLEPFVEKLGIGWHQISTPQPTVAEMFDDKYRLRCIGDGLNMRKAFSPWELVPTDFEQVMKARKRVLQLAQNIIPTDIVYLKVHNYDGGAGILRLNTDTPEKDLRAFLTEYAGHNLIVDAGYPSDVFDTKVCSVKILFHGNRWEPLFFTDMRIDHEAHSGNVVAIGQDVLPRDEMEAIIETANPFNNAARESGYGMVLPRTACIDFLVVRHNGKVYAFMLEYNARSSASDYAMAVCFEAMLRFGGGKAAVVMENLTELPTNLSFNEIRDSYLCGRPWDGSCRPGFLLANAGCLEQGKLTAFGIAPTLLEAQEIFSNLKPNVVEIKRPRMRASA